MKKKIDLNSDFNQREKEILENFFRNIEFEEKKVSSELSYNLIKKVDEMNKRISLFTLLKSWIYAISFTLGIIIGVFVGASIKSSSTNHNYAKIEENTIITEPVLVNLNEINLEKNKIKILGGYNE